MQAKRLLYLTVVRSKLEVGVSVWSSHRKENLMKIEGVQRRDTRFILRSDIGYKDRLSACGLMPLSLQREMLDLSFLFKCRQGFHSLNLCDFCSEYCPLRRTRRASKGHYTIYLPVKQKLLLIHISIVLFLYGITYQLSYVSALLYLSSNVLLRVIIYPYLTITSLVLLLVPG